MFLVTLIALPDFIMQVNFVHNETNINQLILAELSVYSHIAIY